MKAQFIILWGILVASSAHGAIKKGEFKTYPKGTRLLMTTELGSGFQKELIKVTSRASTWKYAKGCERTEPHNPFLPALSWKNCKNRQGKVESGRYEYGVIVPFPLQKGSSWEYKVTKLVTKQKPEKLTAECKVVGPETSGTSNGLMVMTRVDCRLGYEKTTYLYWPKSKSVMFREISYPGEATKQLSLSRINLPKKK